MRLPDGPAIRRRQRLCARGHVVESAPPDKLIRVIDVPKLPDDLNSHGFLRFDKFTVEELDQVIPPARVKGVLPEFDDGGMDWSAHARSCSMIQFVSQVFPPSAEKACSQWQE